MSALAPPLARAVSGQTGIVRSLEESLPVPAEPPHFQATCTVAGGEGVLGTPLGHVTGIGGAGMTWTEAANAAVGEALERYSASFVPPHRLVAATAQELGAAAVEPGRFALFSRRQHDAAGFPFRPFVAGEPVNWVRGWSVADGRPAWLPAELAFLGDATLAGLPPIGYATSSGLACADTADEALVRAACELLERDAFVLAWSNRLSLPRLDWSHDERLVELEQRLFAVTGLAYSVVDLSCFHRLPSFLAVVRAPEHCRGALGLGAGTAASVSRAWWKALAEAFATRSAAAKFELAGPERSYGPAGAGVVTFDDHIRYYTDHRRARAADFLDASSDVTLSGAVPGLEGSDQLAALGRRVRAAGSDLYAVDVTSPDVRELGLVVIRAIAPELCALDVPRSARFLGGRRLYHAAAQLGLRERPLAEDDVNPEPHPFP